eukprot:m.175280 g.175280  ORF g.175280 m.175280 type:complete len:575 (+) comp17918_c0_seq1:147-1871(+)
MALIDQFDTALAHLHFALLPERSRRVQRNVNLSTAALATEDEVPYSPPVELSPRSGGGSGTQHFGSSVQQAEPANGTRVVQWSSANPSYVVEFNDTPAPERQTAARLTATTTASAAAQASAAEDLVATSTPPTPTTPTVVITEDESGSAPSGAAVATAQSNLGSASETATDGPAAADSADSADSVDSADSAQQQHQLQRRESVFTRIRRTRQTSADNPFREFSHLSGEGYGENETCQRNIFFPFSELPKKPLEAVIANIASVSEAVGLICFLYTEENRKPTLSANPARYKLRMMEDDYAPDMDLPPLDDTQPISRFIFPSLCLCESQDAGDSDQEDEDDEDDEVDNAFVRVWFPDGSSSILPCNPQEPVQAVLQEAIRKKGHGQRGAKQSFEDYVLIRKLGGDEEEDVDLSSLLSTCMDGRSLEFIVRSRYGKAPSERLEADVSSAFWAPLSNGPWHFWVSSASGRFSQTTELMISTEKVTINMNKSGLMSKFKQAMHVSLSLPEVVGAYRPEPSKRPSMFVIKYIQTSHSKSTEKTLELEAKTPAEAVDIVKLMEAVLETRSLDHGSVSAWQS